MIIGPIGRWLSAALMVAGLLLIWAHPAAAHTGFESSDPADGAVVDEPVTAVTIRFSGPAAPAGDGFLVRLPTGDVVEPSAVVDSEGTTWRLDFTEPVLDGIVAVTWEVQAPDAHPIAGSFSFTVAVAGAVDAGDRGAEQTHSEQGAVVLPEVPSTSTPSGTAEADASPTVEQFLRTPDQDASGVSLLGYGSRLLGLGGTVAVVGLLVFATSVLQANDPERLGLLGAAGLLGLFVVVGAVGEAAVQTVGSGPWATVTEPSNWAWLSASKAGGAIALRSVGGLAVAVGVWQARRHAHLALRARARPLVPTAVGARTAFADPAERQRDGESPLPHGVRGGLPVLAAGVGLLLTAVAFDGHTVTKGQWLTTALVDIVHVGAAGVWAGGVFGLGAVLVARRRRGVPLDGLRLGMRFSGVAALASALAGVAGVGLAVIVLDDLDELVGTDWGRVLIAKTLFVVAAASIGAYNHFVVLRAGPTDQAGHPTTAGPLRQLVIAEAAILLIVLAITALLVVSDSGV